MKGENRSNDKNNTSIEKHFVASSKDYTKIRNGQIWQLGLHTWSIFEVKGVRDVFEGGEVSLSKNNIRVKEHLSIFGNENSFVLKIQDEQNYRWVYKLTSLINDWKYLFMEISVEKKKMGPSRGIASIKLDG